MRAGDGACLVAAGPSPRYFLTTAWILDGIIESIL